MSETTRITRKEQTTIPQELREKYGLEPGDEVAWKEGDDGIVVRKRRRNGARGSLAPDATPEERRAIAEELTREIRKKQRTEWNIE